MSIWNTIKKNGAVLGAIAIMGTMPLEASAREMRVSSFEPQKGFFSKVLQEWIDKVNPLLSKGNSFKLYPGGILGSPPAQQELVQKGVADIAFVVPSYTAGLFPISSVTEVPGITSTAKVGTKVLHTLLKEGHLGSEYENFIVVSLMSTRGYNLFTTKIDVRLPKQLEGMKMRSHSRFATKLYDTFGASAVTMPAPQIYENLERGIVDGGAWVLDGYNSFRLNEVAPHITFIGDGFTGTTLAFLMNKNTYNSLPDADKKVIMENSGLNNSLWVASQIDAFHADRDDAFRADPSITVNDLNAEEQAAWNAALVNIGSDWIKAQTEFDLDAAPALARAREVSAAAKAE